MVKPSKESFICPDCSKSYLSQAWFKKHLLKCGTLDRNKFKIKEKKTPRKIECVNFDPTPFNGDLLPLVFNFEDEFFYQRKNTPNFPNYLEDLKNFGARNSRFLRIVHLNVNSLFLKKNELLEVVSLGLYDLISINETKLDDSIPSSFFSHPNYRNLRRDRLKDGGGVMVLVKKNIRVIKTEISLNFEGIIVALMAKRQQINVLCCYKPPSLRNKDFLDFLEHFIFSINTNDRFLIIGDLNLDPMFSNFLENFSLKTVTKDPTRIGITYNKTEKICLLLEPFNQATRDLSYDKQVCVSSVYPCFTQMEENLRSFSSSIEFETMKVAIDEMVKKFEIYWPKIKEFSIHCHSLDPRFKLLYIKGREPKRLAKKILLDCFERYLGENIETDEIPITPSLTRPKSLA
ncbi:reverse transcriptase [Brachionus plicatilis]|uniref:Reverse transcriptase n=1 Tax=Brachionus plicatilis TaxID=10195 RepID=A0A3M7RRN4_BRAPC|nr:reverse transcriptase [Brachionus plicatilis]